MLFSFDCQTFSLIFFFFLSSSVRFLINSKTKPKANHNSLIFSVPRPRQFHPKKIIISACLFSSLSLLSSTLGHSSRKDFDSLVLMSWLKTRTRHRVSRSSAMATHCQGADVASSNIRSLKNFFFSRFSID